MIALFRLLPVVLPIVVVLAVVIAIAIAGGVSLELPIPVLP